MQMTSSRTNLSPQQGLREEQKLQVILRLREGTEGTELKRSQVPIWVYSLLQDPNRKKFRPLIYKELVDLQIETNRLREQYETESFELKCEILTLESRVLELELTGEKAGHERAGLAEQLKKLQDKRQELSNAYVSLENNYQTLAKPREPETEDIIASGQEQKKMEKKGWPQLIASQEYIQEEMEKMKLLQKTHQEKLEERVHVCPSYVLGAMLGKELQDAKQEIRDTQHKIDEQAMALSTSQKQLQEVEKENSRLQQQLKMMNDEYRTRLLHYVKKMASYMDNTTQSHQGPPQTDAAKPGAMKKLVDGMLNDMQASHRSREHQLATVARSYKKRMESLMQSHEALLTAFRVQREQIKAQDGPNMEPGPPEGHFTIKEVDLQSSLTQGLKKLREDKVQLETQIQQLQTKIGSNKAFNVGSSLPRRVSLLSGIRNVLQPQTESVVEMSRNDNYTLLWGKPPRIRLAGESHCPPYKNTYFIASSIHAPFFSPRDEVVCANIQKQLQEFTQNTQSELEKERGQLWSRALVAEEQLSQLQEYVDKHLGRYKQEILRLRKLLGNKSSEDS
ncbi:LOW QUALITY PROTEIN: coiled-coil domain-containing protein 78 [Sarcophilus harrisii]